MILSVQPTGTECVWATFVVYLRMLLLGSLLCTFLLSAPRSVFAVTDIVFRYDDFSADEPGVREKNVLRMRIWQAEQAVDKLFAKYGKPYVIAVIPKASSEYGGAQTTGDYISFEVDGEKSAFIRQGLHAGRIELAQHGFSHRNHADANHRRSEFRKRNYQDQYQEIVEGRRILCQSCEVRTVVAFVPPFNGWDADTALAVKNAGFEILSADRFYYTKALSELAMIPFTTRLSELEIILERRTLPNNTIVVVLYHPEDIVKIEGREEFYFGTERLDKLMQQLSVAPDVEIVTLQQLANRHNDLTLERYHMANKLVRYRDFWRKLLPERLWPGEQNHAFYLSADEYRRSLRVWRIATAGSVIALFVAGFCICCLLALKLAARRVLVIQLLVTLVLLLSLLKGIHSIYKGYHVTAAVALPALFLVGFASAGSVHMARRRQAAD